ncbi:MAG: 50S ribosomal protein L18 [Candidatus Marinimicrobia bacterium]|jgi:large subunit ribosomal protein L18|nr:50S ribosomal protein L18 [Candidatus Neomarinimicrobiota bacterium]MDP6568985.1 50S ribosomal protein L18 [Candidatus Neomarinimicrobiota bacterium]MDP7026698.1 50S ribosomal protein L18 [Candidatus Neomarinimicrobiota bacterium]HJL85130.1 50S ribosomal protein L18 [Candidatus Neomarinimicrobiota bacterium]
MRSKSEFVHFERPRLVVYRSLKHIYGQIVDDNKGEVLVSASSVDNSIQPEMKSTKSKIDKSNQVGKILAERAKENKIKKIVFDRNGFLYHGRVKALADGAREGGLEF